MLLMLMLLVVIIIVVDAHRQNTSLHARRIGFKWTALSHLRRSLDGEKTFNIDFDNQPISGGILFFQVEFCDNTAGAIGFISAHTQKIPNCPTGKVFI